jgi:hypothetical protein
MGLENAIKNAHEVARKTLNSTQTYLVWNQYFG